jgi:two-component system, OmpR family, heavy metal sensor histidine kinase CusS
MTCAAARRRGADPNSTATDAMAGENNNGDSHSPAQQGIPRSGRWSLSLRLTAWYFTSSFVILLVATGTLYVMLVKNFTQEHDQFLADKIQFIQQQLRDKPNDVPDLKEEVEETWAPIQYMRVYGRVILPNGKTLAESPHMDEILPRDAFPLPRSGTEGPLAALDIKGLARRETPAQIYRGASAWATIGSNQTQAVLQVALDLEPERKLTADYQRVLLGVLLVALAACAAAGYQIARAGLSPLQRLAATAQRVGPSNLAERVAARGLPSELFTLADRFNAMLDRLEENFALLSRFSADIAHELRTPVNNIRIELEVALAQGRRPEEYRDTLGSALEECHRLTQIIDSLLFIARAEDPRTRVKRELLNVGEELRRIVDFYEATSTDAGVAVITECPPAVWASLDRLLFQRALGNLLSNAIRHTPAGKSITLRASVASPHPGGTHGQSAPGDDLIIEVNDTGEGIAPEDLPRVFDRFYRADRARSAHSQGHAGLGLSIVKSILQLHGGSIMLYSTLGQGTRVLVRFPASVQQLSARETLVTN